MVDITLTILTVIVIENININRDLVLLITNTVGDTEHSLLETTGTKPED